MYVNATIECSCIQVCSDVKLVMYTKMARHQDDGVFLRNLSAGRFRTSITPSRAASSLDYAELPPGWVRTGYSVLGIPGSGYPGVSVHVAQDGHCTQQTAHSTTPPCRLTG